MLRKKKVMLAVAAVLVTMFLGYAKIAGGRFMVVESEKEFDVKYLETEDMEQIQNPENHDVSITKSYKIEKNKLKGELRYSLFTDTGDDDDEMSLKMEYTMLVFVNLSNIAGYQVPSDQISRFNDADVKKEFNGDFGCTAFINNPKSSYSKGYKYMNVDFFYKKKQGLVMRVFLFNDDKFIGMNSKGEISMDSPFAANYHSFKFMEKDKKGNYIK